MALITPSSTSSLITSTYLYYSLTESIHFGEKRKETNKVEVEETKRCLRGG